MESLRNQTIKGVIWSGIERFSVQGVQVLVMLVIARVLTPKDFGLVGMLTIFIAVAQSLIDSGFSQALIRKQDRSEADNSTVFYFNIVVSCGLYLLLFIAAPWVASFYDESQLCSLMRVLCLVIIINSFAVVQRAIYTASINFKTQAKATFVATAISGCFGIWMALNGLGVWTLVYQQLIKAALVTVLLWMLSDWRPFRIFSWKSFKELYSFGWKLLVSGLIDTIYRNLHQLVIGKVFTAVSLGQYTQANTFASLLSSNISGIIQRVTYPVLSKLQDDDERLRIDYRCLLRMSAFIVFPMMCILAGVSKPLVIFLVGEQWELASVLLVPLSFSMMWYPIHAINLNLIKVKGRSDLFLRLEIIKKVIGVIILLVSIPLGILFMCYGGIVSSIICLIINTYYTGKLISVGFFMQIRDLSAVFIASMISAFVAWFVSQLDIPLLCQILMGILAGGSLYLLQSILFRFKELSYLMSIIRNER